MTIESTLDAPPDTSEDESTAAAPRRGRASRGVIVWSAVGLVVILIVVWQIVVAASASMLSISSDARPLVCAKGQETVRKLQSHYVELAKLTPALDCQLRIHIYNGSAFPIHLDRATFDILGPASPTAHIDFIDGQPSVATDDSDSATGRFQDGDLPAGAGFTLVAHVTKSKVTCYLNGSSISWDNGNPTIQFGILGTSLSREANDVQFGFAGTKQSTDASC